MVERDRRQMVIKCCVEKMRFACRVTKARIQTYTITVFDICDLTICLIPSDVSKRFKIKLTITENLRKDLSVITICVAKLYV